ncbi:MAG: toll/interleukin-1 receptor domain-containing protein [Leptolyngbya sp. SIO3F4]|nr:toll/interleukin-1 receptor domain-containing protein [Leptolyngbya sp. SIO3F4]
MVNSSNPFPHYVSSFCPVLRAGLTNQETKENEVTSLDREVFISYAWGGESEEFVNKLDKTFQDKGITIIRDKRDLVFKGRIKAFMERIGRGKAIIVIVSQKYLESANCMFELVQISKNGQFYNRIFPIVLQDANIYNPVQRIKYVQYWEKQIQELDEAMKTVASSNLQGFREDIDLYTEIRAKIADLANILKDMNTLSPNIHAESNFEALFEAIESKIADSTTKPDRHEIITQKSEKEDLPLSLHGRLFSDLLNTEPDITIKQFVSSQADSSAQLAFFIKQIELASPRQDYTKAQFEAYCNVWKSLQALRLLGDDLWDFAHEEILVEFANQLRDTTQLVYENAIFFEESDYSHLRSVLEKFKNFRLGKAKLINIRSIVDLERQVRNFPRGGNKHEQMFEMIDEQILANENSKVKYEKVLSKIRVSFGLKLSHTAQE